MADEEQTHTPESAPAPESPPTQESAPAPESPPTPDADRAWFGGDAPKEEREQPAALADDGRALPEWLPGEYHDPARRADLLAALGFSPEDTQQANRPEWLPEKFKSAEDLATSYKELEQKLSKGNAPPDEYDLQLPEGIEKLSEQDADTFREIGLSNDQSQKLIDYFHKDIVPQIQEQQTLIQQQRLATTWGMMDQDGNMNTESIKTRLAEVKRWADKNVPEGVVKELSRSASGVQQLFQLMQSKGKAAPSTRAATAMDKTQLQQKVNDPRYWSDDAYREQVNQEARAAFDR